MTQTISTKKPVIPVGFEKFKYATGGFKATILGTTVEYDQPVWAEVRYDPKALFKADRKWYRLYTIRKA